MPLKNLYLPTQSNNFISQINSFDIIRKPTSTCVCVCVLCTSCHANQHDGCFPMSIYRKRVFFSVVLLRYNDGKHAMFMSIIIITNKHTGPDLLYAEGGIIDIYYIHKPVHISYTESFAKYVYKRNVQKKATHK